jgi:hypothetical protein
MLKRSLGLKEILGLLSCVMRLTIIQSMYQPPKFSCITLKQDSRKNGVLGVSMQEMDKYLFLKEVIGLLFH